MTDDNPFNPDASRRSVLQALGAAVVGGDGVAQVGGGDAGDSAAQLRGAIYAGPEADRPSAGVAGRYYHATDTKTLFVDDGTSWSTATLSFNAGTETNPVEEVNADTVSTGALTIGASETIQSVADSAIDDNGQLTGGGGVSGTDDPLAIPSSATADDATNMAVGPNATTTDLRAVALGPESEAGGVGDDSVAVGYQATAGFDSVVVGSQSGTGAKNNVLVGNNISNTNSTATVAVGYDMSLSTSGDRGVVIGHEADINAADSISIGENTTVNTQGVGRLGIDQLVFGGIRDTIADADLNNSELTVELDETNSAFRLRGKDSGGTVREATIAW